MFERIAFAAALVAALSACGSSSRYMQPQQPPLAVNPQPNQAVVVFLRPSNYGGAAMFTVVDGQQRWLGDLNGRQYFVTTFPPGQHTFVVHAENNDMMQAELTAGRVYYVLISVRMGAWSARSSISALTPRREEWANLQEWMNGSTQMRADMASAQAAMNPAELAQWIADAQQNFANYDQNERSIRILGPTDGVGPGPQAPPPPAAPVPATTAQPPATTTSAAGGVVDLSASRRADRDILKDVVTERRPGRAILPA